MGTINEIKLRNLKRLMDAHGLNQKGLADRLGVKPPTINRIFTSSRGLGPGLIRKIARALQVPESEFLAVENQATPRKKLGAVDIAPAFSKLTPEQQHIVLGIALEFERLNSSSKAKAL